MIEEINFVGKILDFRGSNEKLRYGLGTVYVAGHKYDLNFHNLSKVNHKRIVKGHTICGRIRPHCAHTTIKGDPMHPYYTWVLDIKEDPK